MAANDQALFQSNYPIDVADLDSGAVTQTFPLRLPQANVMLWAAAVDQVAAFGGGGASTCVARVGSRGDLDALCDDVDIFTGQANILKQDRTATDVPQLSTTVDIIAQIEADVAVNLLTTGSLVVRVMWSPIQR